jgi:hypothetical protein
LISQNIHIIALFKAPKYSNQWKGLLNILFCYQNLNPYNLFWHSLLNININYNKMSFKYAQTYNSFCILKNRFILLKKVSVFTQILRLLFCCTPDIL